jgi:hypothetical protein
LDRPLYRYHRGRTQNDAAPPIDEQRRIINLAATRARAYSAGLPNFICTQSITRSENRAKRGWHTRDALTVHLGYIDRAENYKLVAVNNHPTQSSYESMAGALSEGEFGGVMLEVFRPQTATFIWDHREVLRNRSVDVFSYRIEQAKADFQIKFGAIRSGRNGITVGHHGFISVDPKTGDLLRMLRIADIPARFPIRSANLVLDYDLAEVAGHSYLLPLRAVMEMSSNSLQARNEIQFREYRKFETESSISFDKP